MKTHYRTAIYAAFGVLLLLSPTFLNAYWVDVLNNVGLYAILALSLNIIFITMIMPMGPAFVVLGIVGLAVSQFFIVILLGALSAGIQALRLHYVEFFMKFYRGDGRVFKPFGPANRYCLCTEAAT